MGQETLTIRKLVELGGELGISINAVEMVAIAEDMNWCIEALDAERCARYPDEAIIHITPLGHWDLALNAEPILDILGRGEASPEFQKTVLKKMIEDTVTGRGGFAARRTLDERDTPLRRAVRAVPDIARILASRNGKRRSRKRAIQIAALFYRETCERIEGEVRRGPRARQNQF